MIQMMINVVHVSSEDVLVFVDVYGAKGWSTRAVDLRFILTFFEASKDAGYSRGACETKRGQGCDRFLSGNAEFDPPCQGEIGKKKIGRHGGEFL